jgi:hypothetical protein
MRRVLVFFLVMALSLSQFASVQAQLASPGVITGVVSGSDGVLAGVTVQVLDSASSIVGTAVTTEAGTFSIGGLSTGTFTVHAVGSTGAVIGASTATLVEGAMAAAVTVGANAGAVAAAAAAVVTTTATAGGMSATAVLAAVGAAAAAVGTAAVVSADEPASGSR